MAATSEPADIDAVEPLDDSTARLARRLVAATEFFKVDESSGC